MVSLPTSSLGPSPGWEEAQPMFMFIHWLISSLLTNQGIIVEQFLPYDETEDSQNKDYKQIWGHRNLHLSSLYTLHNNIMPTDRI